MKAAPYKIEESRPDKIEGSAPAENEPENREQVLCIQCGFCCDGTLFKSADVEAGERSSLPEKMAQNWFKTEKGDRFRLPCPYFDHKCTIYHLPKAQICSKYRCQLLNNLADNKTSLEKALDLVKNTRAQREDILARYRELSGGYPIRYFRELYLFYGANPTSQPPASIDKELLIPFFAKCHVFEILLTRYFKSETDFNNLSVKNQ